MYTLIVIGGFLAMAWFLFWVICEAKTNRPDGTLITRIHPYRRMLSFVMPGRNESVVYFDDYVKADALLDYIKRTREAGLHVDVTHCLVSAMGLAIRSNPKMNQFVAGQRLYQRNHIALAFSMKRQKKNRKAKLSAVKLRVTDEMGFGEIVGKINDKIGYERSDAKTYVDKELGLFFKLPRFLMRWCMSLVRWGDYNNLLPAAFIEGDAFFTSVFVANLGSVGMRAGYHHLYEYGTCPLFVMVGRIEERPTCVDGEVKAVNTIHIRFSYDERIDDGLTSRFGIDTVRQTLEEPDRYFGTWGGEGRLDGGGPIPIPPGAYLSTSEMGETAGTAAPPAAPPAAS